VADYKTQKNGTRPQFVHSCDIVGCYSSLITRLVSIILVYITIDDSN